MRMILFILMWAVSLTPEARGAQNVREGRILAIDACSACHQVTPDQKPPAPVFDPDEQVDVVAPPFPIIAKKYAHRASALGRIILSPAHPMREQNWGSADLKVAAYIDRIVSQAQIEGVDMGCPSGKARAA